MLFSLFRKTDKSKYPLNWITPQLAVGHAPMSIPELDSIRKQGIKAIMNLCMEIEALAQLEEEHGFEVYYLPIMDEGFPELKELNKALDWLDESIYLDKKVLVHCRHGVGRTGTVVFSYLLRKGLDPKSAEKKMRGLRARPSEHPQKRFLHLYGKREKPLNIGEPSLVPRGTVELTPYFERVMALLNTVEAEVPEAAPRCGGDHTRCCYEPVYLSLAEAVYLQYAVNTELSSELRREVIDRALRAGASREAEEEGSACPLLRDSRCLLYAYRPAQCRVFDSFEGRLPSSTAEEFQSLSRQILEVFLQRDTTDILPGFHLPDVVSGKFVQRLFYLMAGSP
jgi:protein-tyrosine phosphatase/Fe-S-cluster containining protein